MTSEPTIVEKYYGRCGHCLSNPGDFLKCPETFRTLKCLNCGAEKPWIVGGV